MSMITELIAAITNAERQIDDQISKLHSFQEEIENVEKRVEEALGGSSVQYEKEMIQQLSQTKQQMSDTIERLQGAKEKLTNVRMV